MNNKVAIVIPLYKENLNEYEKISLLRCLNVMSNHRIILVTPHSIKLENISVFSQIKSKVFLETFNDEYFNDVDGYNRLMLSTNFYNRFIDYEYILIHQLDVYIFKDELLYWCKWNYDYVGSPWVDFSFFLPFFKSMFSSYLSKTFSIKSIFNRLIFKFSPKHLTSKFSVGNGGFSLRKVDIFLQILKDNETIVVDWKRNEDIFWSWYVPLNIYPLKRPDLKAAVKFGFDLAPDLAFKLTKKVLPFGAHAWYREDNIHYENNLKFWSRHIDEIKSY